MNLKDSIKEALAEAITGEKKKKTPVCIISQYPDLEEMRAGFQKKIDEQKAIAKKMEADVDKACDDFWTLFRAKLLDKGILTQEEADKDMELHVIDGVVFKS